MKILLSFITLLAVLLLLSGGSLGATVYNAIPGSPIVINATANVPGSDFFVFRPSPFGLMSVRTRSDCFAAASVNFQALGIEGGREYGMAADSVHVYHRSAFALSGLTHPTTSSSAAFVGYYSD